MLFGLICIAVGLSLSKPLMSLGYISLSLSWFLDGKILDRLKLFFRNKIALMLTAIYFLTVLGLLHTSNYQYGLDDTRRKMFLFIMPFLLSGLSPITNKELHIIFKVYIVGVLAATLWSLFIFLGGLNIEIYDSRDYSRFNSHIRFGLEIVLAIFFVIYYWSRVKEFRIKTIWLLVLLWLLVSLYLFNLFTGVVVLAITGLIMMFVLGFFTQKKRLKYILVSIFPLFLLISIWFIKSSVDDYFISADVTPITELDKSKYGEKYYDDDNIIESHYKENGYLIEKNIAWYEFAAAWAQRSKMDIDGKDLKGNFLKTTLIRFVTSKGLRKDREAIESLSEKEVKAIERGIANVKYMHMSFLRVRMHKIIWEFDSYYQGGNYNGHSVVMRWVYWKTAFQILKENFLFGVGTGDVQDEFNLMHEKHNSILKPEYRLRAHNQYITYAVSFGIIGLMLFLYFLIYPMIKTKMYKNYLYLAFFLLISLSMLTEDTLETQVGINLFVFFNSIFLVTKTKQAD